MVEDSVKTLMAFDANGDGKLARVDIPGRFQGIFDRGDTNRDGFLTKRLSGLLVAGAGAILWDLACQG
ncbi:MAG: hypothetical protein WDO73_11600 [Ignavibacteriota bacterium]